MRSQNSLYIAARSRGEEGALKVVNLYSSTGQSCKLPEAAIRHDFIGYSHQCSDAWTCCWSSYLLLIYAAAHERAQLGCESCSVRRLLSEAERLTGFSRATTQANCDEALRAMSLYRVSNSKPKISESRPSLLHFVLQVHAMAKGKRKRTPPPYGLFPDETY